MCNFKNFFWISIEGTDGVGKTRLSEDLYKYLTKKYTDKKLIFINEFSNSPIGILIKRIISEKNFFKIDKNNHYPLAESLILFADFIFQFEREILSDNDLDDNIILVSDRGIYSFLVYQKLRIKKMYFSKFNCEKWINGIFFPIISYPDITICLSSDIDILKERLLKRKNHTTKDNLKFISDCQKEYLKINKKNYFILENNNDFNTVFAKSKNIIDSFLNDRKI